MKRYFSAHPETKLLDEAESHHCTQVIRQRVGDQITVFDGAGREFKSTIAAIEKGRVQFKVLAESKTARSASTVCLAQALAKSKAMDLIIQKATELGVSRLAPLQSERSVAQVDEDRAEAKVEKWRHITMEAAKQCGQNWLPEVSAPTSIRDFVTSAKPFGLKLIASLQSEAQPLKNVLQENRAAALASGVVVMIGPEGDFTPAEIGEARAAGFLPVSLGPVILRSETAAIFALSAILYDLG